MFALYRTLGGRYLRKRWPRAALVVLSIALGVGTWVATGALNNALLKAVHQAATPMGGLADLYVGNGENGVPLKLKEELARVAGIQAVRPLLFDRVRLPVQPDERLESAVLLGVELDPSAGGNLEDWGLQLSDGTVQGYTLGRVLGQRPVVVGEELGKRLPLDANGKFKVLAAGKSLELKQVGTLTAHGPAATLGGNVLVMDLQQAANLLGRPEVVTRLDLSLYPGADREQVQQEVEAVLARRAEVQTPETTAQRVHDVLGGVEVGFLLSGAGALIVGTFLVYNAMAVSVAERRHDIGILRSVGATRNQVRGLFLIETALLGLAGTALGLPLGRVLAYLSLGPMQELVRSILPLHVREIEMGLPLVVSAVAAGLLTAFLAALVPATRAAAEEPADAVRRVPPSFGLLARLVQVGGAAALILGGSVMMALKNQLPPRWGTYAGFLMIGFGALLVTPILAVFLARWLQPLARWFFPLPIRLAADNLVREPGRTGVVVAALAAGVALMVETAGVLVSNQASFMEWVDQVITSDLFVTAGGPVSASGGSLPMDDTVGDQICRAFPGVRVAGSRFRYLPYKDTTVLLNVLDGLTYYEVNRERGIDLPEMPLYPRLAREPNTALVSENFASAHGTRVGDTIELPSAEGMVKLRVIGTLVDYSWARGSVLIQRQRKFQPGELAHCTGLGGGAAAGLLRGRYHTGDFDAGLVDAYDVYLPAGMDPDAVRDRLQKLPWAAENALFGLTRAELREHIAAMIRGLSDLAFPQRIMVGLVAALGVVMALLISVLQRRRELGLLRAAGATRGQVLQTVLAEAVLMGLIGTVIGVAVGIPVEWYVVRVVLFEEGGFLFPVRIPWLDAALIGALSLAVAAVAGLWPAIQATRLRIADVIAYE
jgi:putative ABC transport system permease protein